MTDKYCANWNIIRGHAINRKVESAYILTIKATIPIQNICYYRGPRHNIFTLTVGFEFVEISKNTDTESALIISIQSNSKKLDLRNQTFCYLRSSCLMIWPRIMIHAE